MAKVLVVDDEKNMRWALERALKAQGHEVYQADNGTVGLKLALEVKPNLAMLDLKMPGMDGIALLSALKQQFPEIMVVMITAHGSTSSAVEAMKLGAYDYINKPFDIDELKLIVNNALELESLREKVSYLENEVATKYSFQNMIGKSVQIQNIFRLIERVADTSATVLIQGESGTGKELVARALHYASDRRKAPFIEVNCAALPENLLESELFGHEKGSFTGAITQRQGRFELAHGGTLFLDEIGEISPHVQVRLLRVLQERSFERVGGTQTIKVDVRVIVATNKNLTLEMTEGRFREDLFYRLNVIPMQIPALRNRKEDIPLLIDYFLAKYDTQKRVKSISPSAMKVLTEYSWPGNIRELENTVERLSIVSPGPIIQEDDLPQEFFDTTINLPSSQLKFHLPEDGIDLEQLEKDLVSQAIAIAQGNKTKAAKLLGMSRHTLLYRLEKFGLG